MKNSSKSTGINLKLVIGTALMGVMFASHAHARQYNIDMELNAAQTEMRAVTRGNCDHDGCVQTEKGHDADIHFHLKNEFTDCNRAAGATWELTSVYLGGKNSPTKPSAWGGLDAEVTSDFDVFNAASGVLNHTNGSNKRKISISNKNEYVYDIWYTVVASCVATDGTVLGILELDPRVSNVGK